MTGNISDAQLNQLYGDAGRTFKTHSQAVDYAERIKGARICPILNDVGSRGVSGVMRQIVGYLVSVDPKPPQKPKPRFTGKVRQPN